MNAASTNAGPMNAAHVPTAESATIGAFRTPVRGHAFAGVPGQATVAGRQVLLAREPGNPADPLAVAVWASLGASRWRVGYLDRAVAARIAPRMDAGAAFAGRIEGWVAEPGGRWRRPMLLLESAQQPRVEPALHPDPPDTVAAPTCADSADPAEPDLDLDPPPLRRTTTDQELALAATDGGDYVTQRQQPQRARAPRVTAARPETDNLAARMPGVRRRIVSRAR